MKTKFNKFERVAGLFVVVAIAGSVVAGISVAIKQGWFETKFHYNAMFENADGVHAGTLVQMAGLRAGAVEDVELQGDNKIRVGFYVLGKFRDRVRGDSQAQLIRPFIIGDRVLEITVGSEADQILAEHTVMKSAETLDIMTVMSGKRMNQYFGKMGDMISNIQTLVEAFLDKNRTQSMVRLFDRLDPFVNSMDIMSKEVIKLSRQATNKDGLQKVVNNLGTTTDELNKILPALNKSNPALASDMAKVMSNLAQLTDDFKVLGPALAEVGPELPSATRRALEALNETVVLLKAMQKTFVLKSNVQEVREEESKRMPANQEDKSK